jgi:hypothetical protein
MVYNLGRLKLMCFSKEQDGIKWKWKRRRAALTLRVYKITKSHHFNQQ